MPCSRFLFYVMKTLFENTEPGKLTGNAKTNPPMCQIKPKRLQLNVAGSPTEALLRTPVLRLTAMLRMLKSFPEDLFGDDSH